MQRFSFSVSQGIGIGTYVATDPGSEDLSRLVGTVDLSQLRASTDRQAARQAYRLDGELNAANRGLVDLIEILKMDERFLSVLLALSQEQVVKLSGRGTMYADEAIVAHSNLAEYEAVVEDPKAAALLDRLVVVRMGYPLAVRDEVRVYEKMIADSGLKKTQLSPLALPAAATFAVLTRLSPAPGGWTLAKKLHFYDGRFVQGVRPGDLDELREGSQEDGTFGFSPRYVMNQLSRELSRREGCLSGGAIPEALWEGLTQRAGFGNEDRADAAEVFAAANAEYDELVKRAIRRALVPGFLRQAQTRARNARRDLESWSKSGGGSLDASGRWSGPSTCPTSGATTCVVSCSCRCAPQATATSSTGPTRASRRRSSARSCRAGRRRPRRSCRRSRACAPSSATRWSPTGASRSRAPRT